MKPKITEEISINEMRQLRADGLSNKEITERLEICYPTVLKYLGKQPKGLRTERRCNIPAAQPEEAISVNRLKETARAFAGAAADFTVFENRVRVIHGETAIEFPTEAFREFAKDIIAVSQIVRDHGAKQDNQGISM